jgi:hypothetical protein
MQDMQVCRSAKGSRRCEWSQGSFCVCAPSVFPRRQSLSAPNSLPSLLCPSLLQPDVVSSKLVTLTPGPAGEKSNIEGVGWGGECTGGSAGRMLRRRDDNKAIGCRERTQRDAGGIEKILG